MSYLSPTPGTAGWFDDPTTPGVTRYWDGNGWTDRSFGEPMVQAPAGPAGMPQPAPATWSPGPARRPRPTITDSYAIAALVLGILSWFTCITAPFAIWAGLTSKKRIRTSYGERTGDGMATAGIILAGLYLGLIVVLILAIVALGGSSTTPPPQ